MKVVVLAGGYGTRISEESHLRPKPMIEIGGKPMLWHIMKEYSYHGFNEFIICAGYKQHVIKEWFANYYLHNSDVTFDFTDENRMTVHNNVAEPWKVTIVDTGLDTMTGGRIRRVRKYIGDETFMLIYGDAVCTVDMNELLEVLEEGANSNTLELDPETKLITSFREKEETDSARINGGYMVLEPKVFDYLEDDSTIFEQKPMRQLAKDGELNAYEYDGFWQCMDTKREHDLLDRMIESGNAPWMVW